MNLPSPDHEPERYEDRPLLILLEGYVLDCIGELPDEKRQGLDAVVQRVFGGDDGWKPTLRSELGLKRSLDRELAQLWETNKKAVEEAGETLQPVQFAKLVVDENFAHLFPG